MADNLEKICSYDHIYLLGELTSENNYTTLTQLTTSLETDNPVALFLDTSGGDIASTIHLINFLKRYQKKVVVVALREVSSCGLEVFFSFPLKQRYSYPLAVFSSHQNQYALSTDYQNYSDFITQLKDTLKDTKIMEKVTENYLNKLRMVKNIVQFNKFFVFDEKFKSAAELVKAGYIKKENIL